MKARNTCLRAITLLSLLFCCSFIFDGAANDLKAESGDGNKLYTAYNIWRLPGYNMMCINYKYGHNFIPAGTEVEKVVVNESASDPLSGGGDTMPSIEFKPLTERRKVKIYFYERFHPGKSIIDYKNMMITTKDITELTRGLADYEIQAINQGTVVDGMSKEAVILAYGPPPEHATPSLDNRTWVYWKNKRRDMTIYFGEDNRTINTGYPRPAPRPNLQGSPDDLAKRLKALEDLFGQGLITEEEYQDKRSRLLNQL